MKAISFITQNFKNIMIGVLIVFLIIALMKCNGSNKRLEKAMAANAMLDEQKKQDSINYLKKEARWQDSIHNAGINSELQVKVIKETEKKLAASQSSVNRLIEIIRNAPTTPDSSFVLVSPQFKEACDSLPDKIDSQNVVIASLKENNDGLVDLMNYETTYRDSLIEVEREQIDNLNKTIIGKDKVIEETRQAAEPKGIFLIGVGIMGNQDKFFGGGSLKFSYLTKNGKMYQYSPHVLQLPGMPNPAVFHEASLFIRPFK